MTKILKYFPITMILVTVTNLAVFKVFEKTSNTPAAVDRFLKKNGQIID